MEKFVYSFNEGNKDMRYVLGGKGANLAEMTKIGLPVPYGFTVTCQACNKYYEDGKVVSDDLVAEIMAKLEELEKVTGKKFGDPDNPLLVSVRSGAPFSMPGMMDTILNLGLNDDSVLGIAKLTNNERFAYDSYRRFIQMYSDIVLEIPKSKFDVIFDGKKDEVGAKQDVDLSAEDLKAIIEDYKKLVLSEMGQGFPEDPRDQLMEAVLAVFRSWNTPRAVLYRELNNIDSSLGTAVNVQEMAFGNMGDDSCTGVAFTRSPSTGEKKVFGEFLVNAQGEDVVAGIRTPQPIAEMADTFPEVYEQFTKIAELLETHYKNMQDMEFTVERGKLYMLQTRDGKRTAQAAVKVACDMVEEGLITKEVALSRIEPEQIDMLLHPKFSDEALDANEPVAKGLPASPGAASGRVYFTAEEAAEAVEEGKKVILVRAETSPEDLAGMVVAEGILTERGGMTSHAAVVARGMGKCCVAGCSAISPDESAKTLTIGDLTLHEGDFISIDGSAGNVYVGELEMVAPDLSNDFAQIMEWADQVRRLKVRTNADNPTDAAQAVKFGAEGIGLCRTEHMFFGEERIKAMRRMILAHDEEERREALKLLLPYQKEDFKGIFEVMEDRPVTIRTIDPPLHEFVPHTEEDIKELADEFGLDVTILRSRVAELKEFNPMLGHRGCRLTITYPEIAEMQGEAIISAAVELKKEKGLEVTPEIMIPLVGNVKELAYVKKRVVEAIEKVFEREGESVNYIIGTMIEIPRAALTADEVATEADFFSFGTNDLTQMTLGFSRDDTGNIINEYLDKGVFEKDPFQTLDQTGVGQLVEMAAAKGRKIKNNLKLGICGEHGGDPDSIEFCHKTGLDYVSCSPFRVPIARLAAAQAVVKEQMNVKNDK